MPLPAVEHHRLADHSADRRMVLLVGMALVVGTGGAFGAWLLLRLIAIATNLFWFGRISASPVQITDAALGVGTLVVPVVGSLLVGLMARFGSDKIRGHGIPEAIEAILFGESRLSLKVAILKPLSSAISIGSGGPFGAEGPIIMTGGAIGSLFAQCFHLSAAERKTLLVAGAAAGMTAIFNTPLAAVLLAVELLLFEWKPRSFVPVVVAVIVAWVWRPVLIGAGPMFPVPAVVPGGSWPIAGAVGVGLAVGVQAAFLSVALYRIEDIFHRLPIHWMWWPALGAVAMVAVVAIVVVPIVVRARVRPVPPAAAAIGIAVVTVRIGVDQPPVTVVVIAGRVAAVADPAEIAVRAVVAVLRPRLAVVVIAAVAIAIGVIGRAAGQHGGGQGGKQVVAQHGVVPPCRPVQLRSGALNPCLIRAGRSIAR